MLHRNLEKAILFEMSQAKERTIAIAKAQSNKKYKTYKVSVFCLTCRVSSLLMIFLLCSALSPPGPLPVLTHLCWADRGGGSQATGGGGGGGGRQQGKRALLQPPQHNQKGHMQAEPQRLMPPSDALMLEGLGVYKERSH